MKLRVLCVICALLCIITVTATGCGNSYSEGSVVGTWSSKSTVFIETESTDESDVTYYYTFDEDGKLTITTGTFSVIGKWNYVDSDGKKIDSLQDKVKIEVQTVISGTFSAEVKAGKNNKYTLKLTDDSNETMTLNSAEIPETKNKVDDGFKEVDFITGKWQSVDNDEVVYIFNSDGTCELTQTSLHINGSYKVNEKNKIIAVTYMDKTQNTWNIPYLVKEEEKGQKITFANSVFKKI